MPRLRPREPTTRAHPKVPPPNMHEDNMSTTASLSINYPPDFKPRWGYGKAPARHIARILEAKADAQRAQLTRLAAFRTHLSAIRYDEPEESPEPRWHQPWFPALDGISVYGLVAERSPAKYVEIGSGNSTKFAHRAIRDHGLDTRIVSIDPMPRAEVDAICDRVIRHRLEECDLSIFDEVSSGDVVFFDGSHRCLQNSDVTVFFMEVLPALKKGTLVGIHDIWWPNDYPEHWVARYYSEQYILGAHMLALGTNFPLVLSNAWAGRLLAAEARACLSPEILSLVEVRGGALWFEVLG